MRKQKIISIFEMSLMILSLFAFSFFVAETNIKTVSATQLTPSGCCLETKTGALCQEMNLLDAAACTTDLIGTGCQDTQECQKGCCYNSNAGVCTMNSPQGKCESSGGNWSSDANCNIDQCSVGCCIAGDGASMSTSRECTLISQRLNIDKNFKPLDAIGSCSAYSGLSEEGACLTSSNDGSPEKNCIFTAKKNCNGEFKQGFLCTSKELNTICTKTEKTSCFENKDQIYFIDSCGNRANIYDATKANKQDYWEKYIAPDKSCQTQSASCGNCDYSSGSTCSAYSSTKGGTKPEMGNNVCKNLNCGDKKHGDSWCVYDSDPSKIALVGSRQYVASCFEGEISIEGCADFNQEVCAQITDKSRSQAKCLINDWRSCLYANDKESYSEVKTECDKNPQCMMFNQYFGEDKLKRSDGTFFAGFKQDVDNSAQGSIGDLGADQNKVLSHCVPRFTPGFQFWTTNSDPLKDSSGNAESTANYGGSELESDSICSLGDFTCVSEKHRKCTLGGGCDGWKDGDLNWECNIDGETATIKGTDLPNLMNALNERCRALGTCGVSSNIAGQVNSQDSGITITRMKIGKTGDVNADYSIEGYDLSQGYLNSIKTKTATIKSLKDLQNYGKSGISSGAAGSGNTPESKDDSVQPIGLEELAASVDVGEKDLEKSQSSGMIISSLAGLAAYGAIAGAGALTFGAGVALTGTAVGTVGATTFGTAGLAGAGSTSATGLQFAGAGYIAGAAIIGAIAGYYIGGMIAKNQDWSPGKQQQFTSFCAAAGGTLAATGTAVYMGWGATAAVPVLGWVVLIIMALWLIYESFFNDFKEQEFYIMKFECNSWQPPLQGDCNICNTDVRPCSEYKCKSLGNNCHYFNQNGDPGVCASMADIWQAIIKPDAKVLSEGAKYSEVKDQGFEIQGKTKAEVDAWKPLTFGITTDKQAVCKIDTEHTKSYDEMKYQMLSLVNQDTNKAEGAHHQITLSPHVALLGEEANSSTTLPIESGENEYYIRCKNFAGQTNEAEFTVQVKMADGPDLTNAQILSTDPEDGAYLKQGSNSTELTIMLDEPAECRYAIEYDKSYFSEMENNMTCLTSKSAGYYGQWPCFANIENLTQLTELFIKCKDQPGLVETDLITRNGEDAMSKKITLNICQQGLEITSTKPATGAILEINSSVVNLEIQTSGCINRGEAICSYNIEGFGDKFTSFIETGKNIHKQTFNTLGTGDYKINLKCEDSAKNQANQTIGISIYLDDLPPMVTRAYKSGTNFIIKTSEESRCAYKLINSTDDCNFDFNSTSVFSIIHNLELNKKGGTYAVKCIDKKGNIPSSGCSGIFKIFV